MRILQLKGKEQQLYQLLAPLVMDPEVIRANNNYPFKTGDNYVWFIAVKGEEVKGFMPIEQRASKKAIINNYYVAAEDKKRQEILSALLKEVLNVFVPDKWLLSSVTLMKDKETFELFDFAPIEKNWKLYVKMIR